MIEFPLPFDAQPVLAAGAYLKNAVGAAKGRLAVMLPARNDLQTPGDIRKFKSDLQEMMNWLGGPARLVAHDLHPDFPNTRHVQTLGLPTLAVQHHHAHVAAVAAEHGVTGPVIGLALDGFGLGPDNQAWGGELLYVDGPSFERLGHLQALLQPGGDIAARQPWRMGASVLHALGRGQEIKDRYADQAGAATVAQMLDRGFNAPGTSSCGRLFDAACGLLNLLPVAEFEGQAPMALERLATAPEIMTDGYDIRNGVLSLLPLLSRLVGLEASVGANLFHGTLAKALADFASAAARAKECKTIALSGGCFLNAVLTAEVTRHLAADGFTVLKAQRLSPGDGGLALGQAWIAALSCQ